MRVAIAGLVLVCAAAVGCGSGGAVGGGILPPGGDPAGFADVQAQILTPRCAVSGCHVGAGAPFGLDLSAGSAYGAVVDVPSGEAPTFLRVEPGNAADSYLFMKLTADPRILGDPMPLTGPPLSDGQLALVAEWIELGAAP